MSLLRKLVVAVSAAAAGSAGMAAVAVASPPTIVPLTEVVGQLGVEGGAAPGPFRPTAGSVEVEYTQNPLIRVVQVGPSGKFAIPLGPGTYNLVGCGPSSSTGQPGLCGKPLTVKLKAGQVDHVRLVWAYLP